jgi:hypothetical protein
MQGETRQARHAVVLTSKRAVSVRAFDVQLSLSASAKITQVQIRMNDERGAERLLERLTSVRFAPGRIVVIVCDATGVDERASLLDERVAAHVNGLAMPSFIAVARRPEDYQAVFASAIVGHAAHVGKQVDRLLHGRSVAARPVCADITGS